MDEQTQAQFIQWLGGQLGVSSEEELEQAVGEIDDQQMQQLFAQFQQETQAQAFKKGGQINYLKKLKTFKVGGKVKSASIKEGSTKAKSANTKGLYKPSKKWDFGKEKQDRKETKSLMLNSLVNKNKLK